MLQSRALVGDAEKWLNAQSGEIRFDIVQLLKAMGEKFGPEASSREVITRLMQARTTGRSKEQMREYVDMVNSLVAALDDKSFKKAAHTSELQSLMRISYAVFCLKKKKQTQCE